MQPQRRTITLAIGRASTDPLFSPTRTLVEMENVLRLGVPRGTDAAASGAHPHSDVVLDKWLPAIKSIRRDMALSRRVMLDALRGPAIYVLPRDRDPSPSEASARSPSTFRSPGRFIGSRYPGLSPVGFPVRRRPQQDRFVKPRRLFPSTESIRAQSIPSKRHYLSCVPAFGHSRDR